jgi:hypothetical protein
MKPEMADFESILVPSFSVSLPAPHDSSLSKYCKQKQSSTWTYAIFNISRRGLLLFTVLAE